MTRPDQPAAQKLLREAITIKAQESMSADATSTADATRVPLLYLDPMFDQILIMFPQDNLRELNRRLRHYYKYDPYVRSIIDFHTETPISDFELRCPENPEAQDYYNDFKDRKNLINVCSNLLRDYWLLGESFFYGNWDADNQEFLEFVQLPPEEVEVHSAYISTQRVYVLRPNREIAKMMKSSNIADRALSEMIRKINPEQAEHLKRNRPFPLDTNRLIVMQREMSGYSNRGVSPVMAVVKDLMFQDFLHLFRTVFIQRHCLSADTDVLTLDGFKNITELKKGDTIASFNPTTEQMEYHPAIEMYEYDYDGDMIEYDTPYCRLMATPEHKMWLRNFPHYKDGIRKDSEWKMVEAQNTPIGCEFRSIANWMGIEPIGPVTIGDKQIPIKPFLKLAGFFIAEGCCSEDRTMTIVQSAKSAQFNAAMQETIGELPIAVSTKQYHQVVTLPDETKYEHDMCYYKVFSEDIAQYMQEQFGRGAINKKIPSWIKMLSKEYLQILLDAMMLGDGCTWNADGVNKRAYYTSSKQLADDVQEIAIKLGYSAIIRTPQKMGSVWQKHQRYIISFGNVEDRIYHKGRYPRLWKKNQIKNVHYTGKVYCPSVPPHHLIFARRNGRVVITGQSYPLKMFKIGSEAKGFMPSKKMLNDFRGQLLQAINDPDYNLITHPFVTVESHSGHDKILPLIPYYDLVKQRIFAGLFVSEAIVSGEKTPYAGGITFMRGLMNRYLTVRNNLEIQLKQKVFAPLARKRGFVDKHDNPILPKFFWHKANLLSSQAIQTMLINLREKGELPFQHIAEMFGFDTEDIAHQFKIEEGTRTDQLWRKVRDEAIVKNKTARTAYLQGANVEDALKAAIEAGDKSDEGPKKELDKGVGPSKKMSLPTESPTAPQPEELKTEKPARMPGEALPEGAPSLPGERRPRPGETPEGPAGV